MLICLDNEKDGLKQDEIIIYVRIYVRHPIDQDSS